MFAISGESSTTRTVGFNVDYSHDGGTTWINGYTSPLLDLRTDTHANQLLAPTLGAAFMITANAGQTFAFRVVRTGENSGSTTILSQFLLLEELRA